MLYVHNRCSKDIRSCAPFTAAKTEARSEVLGSNPLVAMYGFKALRGLLVIVQLCEKSAHGEICDWLRYDTATASCSCIVYRLLLFSRKIMRL